MPFVHTVKVKGHHSSVLGLATVRNFKTGYPCEKIYGNR